MVLFAGAGRLRCLIPSFPQPPGGGRELFLTHGPAIPLDYCLDGIGWGERVQEEGGAFEGALFHVGDALPNSRGAPSPRSSQAAVDRLLSMGGTQGESPARRLLRWPDAADCPVEYSELMGHVEVTPVLTN